MTARFRILVSDKLAESGLVPLNEAPNVDVDVRTELTPDQLIEVIPDYDALLVRSSTQVTPALLRAGTKLQVVARAGIGVDNIDLDAATQCGVIVVNAPTGNVVAAAEHTIAMLMALARSIPLANQHVQDGRWKRSEFVGVEVRGKTLGVIGFGRIAREVAERGVGLGMKVIAYDPYVTADFAAQRGVKLVSLDDLVAQCDFLTVHVPMTDTTHHMIGRAQLARMKQGARLLNVARGGIIEEVALAEAINSGHIAGAAIDVFEVEPLPADSPLRGNPKIILTPHLGGSTVEAQEKVAEDVAVQVLDVLNGHPARYAVNAPILPPKSLIALVPYIDLAERMGRFLRQMDGQGINHLEVTAHGPIAEHDLAYVKAGAIKGVLTGIVADRVNLVNAELLARQQGMAVVERKVVNHHERYESMLTLRMTSGGETRTVRGAFVHEEPLIVAIDDLWVDFRAEGHLLLASHNDRPGMIGRVGTFLGQSDINISFMHVGRRAPRGEAIMVLGTDEPVPTQIIGELSQLSNIRWMKAVCL